MPIPDFVVELRELVGTRQLWLPAVPAVVRRGDEVLLTRRADNGQWAPVTGIIVQKASRRMVGGEAHVADDENVEVRWWPLDALPEMAPFLLERIDAAVAGEVAARFTS